MYIREITFLDLDGKEVTEEFLFNLRQDEAIDLQLSEKGGLDEFLKKIARERDGREITRLLKTFILACYGERGADNKRFIKSPELSLAFSQTAAYTELWTELVTDEKAAADFIEKAFEKPRVDKDKPENAGLQPALKSYS